MVASKEKPGAAALDSAPDESAPEESDFQLQLAQKLCMLRLPSMSDAGVPGVGEGVVNGEAADIAAIQAELLERGMAKKYEAVCGEFELMVDAEKLESVNTANAGGPRRSLRKGGVPSRHWRGGSRRSGLQAG